MKPWARWALRLLLLLACWGPLCICHAISEDPGTEGLSSTSLVDFRAMSHLDSLDSGEQPNLDVSEPDLFPSALQASPGSGFSSEENDDSKVVPSQYFWEDGGDINDSSLDVGPASDYSFPVASQKSLSTKNGTQAKNPWEVPIFHQPSDSVEPNSEAPSTSDLEEEEGLLPINQSKQAPQGSHIPQVTISEAPSQDSLYTILFSTIASRMGPVTEEATEKPEDESAPEHISSGFDIGSSMGPSLLPVPSILSATPKDPHVVSEFPLKIPSESTVATAAEELIEAIKTGGTVKSDTGLVETTASGVTQELPNSTAGAGMEEIDSVAEMTAITDTETDDQGQAREDLLITGSHADDFQVTETISRTPNSPSSSSSSGNFWDWTDDSTPTPSPAPIQNSTKMPVTTTVATQQNSVPQSGDVRTAVFSSGLPWSLKQVTCKDWSNLAGKNYIILNMSDNIDCEEFRVERGIQLLALVEDAFSRLENGLQGQWFISLSKPNENDKHLLMTLAGEHGVVPTNDVLLALGDMRRSLAEIGIQNYTTTSSCQSRPSQTHSDYGKLFVVLVIIGSICVIIIIMGLIYNCWQRRLPKMKNMSHGEELRFVENGCHDNPTLDVASDSQSEMQEKKPSVNGGGAVNGPESWDVLINKRAGEEGDAFEEDTHL